MASERGVEIAGLVRNENIARTVIAELITRFGSDAAIERLTGESRFAHQTTDETAHRVAGNLLRNFVTRKPGGLVVDY